VELKGWTKNRKRYEPQSGPSPNDSLVGIMGCIPDWYFFLYCFLSTGAPEPQNPGPDSLVWLAGFAPYRIKLL